MTVPPLSQESEFYGIGSSPTTQQILEGIVQQAGKCYQSLRYCVPMSSGLRSDRDGDPCPMFQLTPTARPNCPDSEEERCIKSRQLLMELTDYGQLQ